MAANFQTLSTSAHGAATVAPAIWRRVPKATAVIGRSLTPVKEAGSAILQTLSATANLTVTGTMLTRVVGLAASVIGGKSIGTSQTGHVQALAATAQSAATIVRRISTRLSTAVLNAAATLTGTPSGGTPTTTQITIDATLTASASIATNRPTLEATVAVTASLNAIRVAVNPPATAAFTARAERVGGEDLRARYWLVLPSPNPVYSTLTRTWLLSEAETAATMTADGVHGIVKGPTPVQATAGLGGMGSAGFTLTLLDHEGTMGQGGRPGGRFSDWFGAMAPEPPPFGTSELYDLDSATVRVELGWADLDENDWLTAGHYVVVAHEVTAAPEQLLTLTLAEDTRFHQPLPRRRFTLFDWPQLPEGSIGEPYPLVFGRDQILPLRNVDGDGGIWIAADSPIDTPVLALKQLWVVAQGTTGGAKLIPLRGAQTIDTDASALYKVSNPAATKTNRTLNEIAQYLPIPGAGGLASMVRIWLRITGLAPIGSLTLAIVKDNDGTPGSELVDPNASIEVDAAGLGLTTVFTEYTFSFQANGMPTAIILAEGPAWLVVKYANDSGGAINVAVNTSAPHDDGFAAYRDTTSDEWIPLGRLKKRTVVRTNFTGQGYISLLPNATRALRAASGSFGYQKALLVGRDADRFGTGLHRAFLRFKISDFPAGVANAVLILNLARKGSGASAAELREVVDFGTLTTTHWDQPERGTISTEALTSDSEVGDPIIVTVTTAYNAAKAAGLAYFALKFQLADETETAITRPYYGILATGPKAPALRVAATAGTHVFCYIGATAVTMEPGYQSLASLNHFAGVTIGEHADTAHGLGVPLHGDATLAVTVDGMRDTTSGTYTGTASALIERGSDMILWLARHASRGLALEDERIDQDSFATSRVRLRNDWFALAGTLFEVRDSREWIAEIAKACKSTVFLNQGNQLAIYTDGPTFGTEGGIPVATVYPWEHGPLRTSQIPGAGESPLWPLTKVVVWYGRDLLSLPNADGRRSREAGWDGYTVLSWDLTDPPDAERQIQALAWSARYQTRQQGPATDSPDALTAYAFVPLESGTGTATGVRLRNWLWDQNYRRSRPFDLLEIALPRRALSWRIMEDIAIESWAFPWDAARVRPGEAVWASDGVMDGNTTRFYQARRGLFSIRDLRITAAHGPDYAVVATLKLRGWEV